jgi:hypothetical protein
MESVKKAVLALNVVNDEADGGMIETDQREQLCLIIDRAARQAGLEVDDYDDLAGEWRDW